MKFSSSGISELVSMVNICPRIMGRSHPVVERLATVWCFRFDHYLGIPYSHDMCPCTECFPGQPCHDSCRPDTVSCPLFRDQTIIQQPADLTTLTNTYTQEAVKFIKVNGWLDLVEF